MELLQGVFAVKLCELEEEYGRLLSRIRICQEKDPVQIRRALDQLRDECREQGLLLEQRVKGGRMRSAAELSQAQLTFAQKVEQILWEELPGEMQGHNRNAAEDRAEVSALYAEYAIDFATQAVRHALCAALQALECQNAGCQNDQKGSEPYE